MGISRCVDICGADDVFQPKLVYWYWWMVVRVCVGVLAVYDKARAQSVRVFNGNMVG